MYRLGHSLVHKSGEDGLILKAKGRGMESSTSYDFSTYDGDVPTVSPSRRIVLKASPDTGPGFGASGGPVFSVTSPTKDGASAGFRTPRSFDH